MFYIERLASNQNCLMCSGYAENKYTLVPNTKYFSYNKVTKTPSENRNLLASHGHVSKTYKPCKYI